MCMYSIVKCISMCIMCTSVYIYIMCVVDDYTYNMF